MRKFDLRKIMKRAWELVKSFGRTMSAALKTAWAEAKKAVEKVAFDKYGEVRVFVSENSEAYDEFYFTKWEKYGKKRIYFSDSKFGGMHPKCKGYIDCNNGNAVVWDKKPYGIPAKNDEIISNFFAKYEIA